MPEVSPADKEPARDVSGRFRPTPDELLAAAGRTVPDVIGPRLRVLFCGINPGLWTAAVGHHFARPGNRFWKVLHRSGFTPSQLEPENEGRLLELGLGITNLVARASASAGELTTKELVAGADELVAKLVHFEPAHVAVLGVGAFRRAFARPKAPIGEQHDGLGPSRAWVLPNPSGLQARYQLDELTRLFAELRRAVESEVSPRVSGGGRESNPPDGDRPSHPL